MYAEDEDGELEQDVTERYQIVERKAWERRCIYNFVSFIYVFISAAILTYFSIEIMSA